MHDPRYRLRAVTKVHGTGPTATHALRGVDLDIADGELLAITGASGAGKSTLLQLLGGLDRPTSGSVELDGTDLAALSDRALADVRARRLGFVFQAFNLIPTLTALDNVVLAMVAAGVGQRAARTRARQLLGEVGLADRAGHLPGALSGGEQQRVAIARALANDPPVLLADEPTGNLDRATGAKVLDLLRRLHAAGRTIVLVTHDPTVAAAAERTVVVSDGRLAAAVTEAVA